MGSKFLTSGGGDLAALQDGSFALNVSSAILQTLTPSIPVKTSATKELVSGLIQLADCAFTPLTNPATSNLNLASYAITNAKEMLLELNAAPTTPAANMLTIYTSGDKLRYKDDTTATYQVATSTDLATYLPLGGGTMSGAINMGAQTITNVSSIGTSTDNILIGNGAAASGASNVVIGDRISFGPVNRAIATSAIVGDGAYATGNLATVLGYTAHVEGAGHVAIGSAATVVTTGVAIASSVAIGNGAEVSDGSNAVSVGSSSKAWYDTTTVVGSASFGNAIAADVFGAVVTNTTANSLAIAASVNFRSNSASTCDLGTTAKPFKDIILAGNVAGTINTRAANNIVSNTGASVSGNIASLSGTTGKVITDSGVAAASVVLGPASSVNNQVALFNGTTGKAIQVGTAAIGTLGALTLANTTASTTTGTGALICAGGAGIAGAITAGGAIKTTITTASSSTTTGSLICAGGLGVNGTAWLGGLVTLSLGVATSGLLAGTGTLVAGTLVVSTTNILSTDRVIITRTGVNGSTAIGNFVYTIAAFSNFTITSVRSASPATTETNDVSTFSWVVLRLT